MKEDRLVQIQNVMIPCVDTGFDKNELVDVVIRPEDLVDRGGRSRISERDGCIHYF